MMKFNPTTVYRDFAKALNGKATGPELESDIGLFADNTELSNHVTEMSEILDILSKYEDKTLKKKDPAYWNVLVDKGIVSATDVPLLQQKIKEYNTLAHCNEQADKIRPILVDDIEISELNENIHEAHQKKILQWLYETDRSE